MEKFFRAYFPDANIKNPDAEQLDLLEKFEKKSNNDLMDEKRYQKILNQIKSINSQNEEILYTDLSHLKTITDMSVIENYYFRNTFNLIHFSNYFFQK